METNSASNILHTYLDGELEQILEKPLFEELASNTELRSEMRDLLTMRSAIHHDVEAFAPPFEATNAIFTTLGFSSPISTPITLPVESIGAAALESTSLSSLSLWTKLWHPFTTMVIGGVIVYLFLNWGYTSALTSLQNDYNSQLQNIRSQTNTTVAQEKESAQRNNQQSIAEPQVVIKKMYYPVVKYIDRTEFHNVKSQHVLPPENISEQTNNFQIQQAISTSTLLDTPLAEKNTQITSMEDKQKSVYFVQTLSNISHSFPINGDDNYDQLDSPFDKNYTNLSLKLSGNAVTLGASTTSNLKPQQAFGNNFSGEFAWMMTSAISFGAVIGREPFPMTYTGMTNGRKTQFDQYSSIFWGGLSALIKPSELEIFHFQLYSSTVVGGSELGPLLREEIGFQIPLTSQFSFSSGATATGLFYQFQSTNFSTWKFGINSGIVFNF